MKSTTKLSTHELVKSHFVLPVTLSGAKRENFPLLLHNVERIIVGNYFIDGLKSRAIFSTIAPISFPRYLFSPRPWERGCHCIRAYFSALLEVANWDAFSLVLCAVGTFCDWLKSCSLSMVFLLTEFEIRNVRYGPSFSLWFMARVLRQRVLHDYLHLFNQSCNCFLMHRRHSNVTPKWTFALSNGDFCNYIHYLCVLWFWRSKLQLDRKESL